jgi:outer membrane receptor protein involved in Fe transport
MKQLYLLIALLLILNNATTAQTIQGVLYNNNLDAIADATISNGTSTVLTNNEGVFTLPLTVGSQTITIKASGYVQKDSLINITSNEVYKCIWVMQPKKGVITSITVSGSRYKKRSAEEIVSIEIIKPEFIKNAAINRVDEALNKMPGVDVIDNQINIRGGAGWSYGAGSRVMVLVDDMPMLSADAQDAKWDFLPLESCEQIEILKGAAGALYGSSALNGVVHFRTAYTKNKPITRLQMFNGIYGQPARKELVWWGKKQPQFGGGYVSHAQKFGSTDVVAGAAWFTEDSYLQGDATRRIRFNTNIRHKVKNIEGLILGLNANLQVGKSSTFFLHAADTSLSNLLQPYGGIADSTTTLNKNTGTRWYIDPTLTYYAKNGWTHNVRTRYLFTQNLIPEKKQTSTAYTLYGEYQFTKKWTTGQLGAMQIIGGLVAMYNDVKGDLYGVHTSNNYAPYIQAEKKVWHKIWLVAGARYENNKMDKNARESKLIVRTGLNWELAKATNLRASFGQGYRYPTIAERFVQTNFGAASVFPNPALKSETGFSTELGIKQGFAYKGWMGFADASLFWMQYKDMMEFNFGVNLPADSPQVASILPYLGFQSRNIGNTDIRGLDLSCFAQKHTTHWMHTIMLGYTYILPTQIRPDSAILANISTERNFLKYRFQHSIKASWDIGYKKWTLASINTINSSMINIDEVFENNSTTKNAFGAIFDYGTGGFGAGLPSTIRTYRSQYNTWRLIADVRLGYQINKQTKAAFVVKNVLNTEYYARPALIGPPRNYTVQLFVNLE